jgi:hypothetical protein
MGRTASSGSQRTTACNLKLGTKMAANAMAFRKTR